jgi:CheY-like chemotaxis protein
MMNLAVNARDAMPEGGTLRIATEMVDHDQEFVAAHPGSAPGLHVRLTFGDTGVGMTADVLAHLFEPFFTTKGQGKGTGLGLATVYGIAKQSGGYVWVESEPGAGTSFMICFPCIRTDTPEGEALPAKPRAAAGTETILFVEDQVEVRDAVRRSLQRRGYSVIEAADGPTALELMSQHAGPIHLLLTDVVMPQMSGRALADIVTSRKRGTRVLYMTGYTDDAIVRSGVIESGVDLIRKPFMPDQLLSAVREILDRPLGAAVR